MKGFSLLLIIYILSKVCSVSCDREGIFVQILKFKEILLIVFFGAVLTLDCAGILHGMVGTPAEFHLTMEGILGSNSWISDIIAKLKVRLGCKCQIGMTDDEFARKFLAEGFLNMMSGGAFSGETGKGDFSEQCPVMHSIWDLLTDFGMKDLEFALPTTCTYSSYKAQVINLKLVYKASLIRETVEF